MKVLIIENEYDLDNSIKAFLKDVPDVFESVDIQLFSLNRSVGGMFELIKKVDTILIATTFMYKDQVIEYIDAFLKLPEGIHYNFFVHSACFSFNDMKRASSWETEKIELREKVIMLMDKGHTIYDFAEDGNTPFDIEDDYTYPSTKRHKYRYDKLEYDHETNTFHIPTRPHYTLADNLDD